MGKLRLDINSTSVLGTFGIVNIVFNGTNLAASKQLSATVESLEYNADILTSSDNILKISLLNDQAHDTNVNGDSDFTDAEDQILKAVVSSLSYSIDGVTFTTLLPQVETTHTVPSGTHAGKTVIFNLGVSEFVSYGLDYELKFDTNSGLLNTPYLQGYATRLVDGVYYDAEGNVIPN
jgi:hypothetical protein